MIYHFALPCATYVACGNSFLSAMHLLNGVVRTIIVIASEARLLQSQWQLCRMYVRAFWSRGPVNAQMSGRPVKDQRSLKSPRKRLIPYLTLSGKIAATAMDKELNTRQDVLWFCQDVQNSS